MTFVQNMTFEVQIDLQKDIRRMSYLQKTWSSAGVIASTIGHE